MDGLFRDFATIDYPIIDADSHVNEPADLWQQSVPESLKARAPRVESSDKGDIWVFDDGKETWPLGLTAVAGHHRLVRRHLALHRRATRSRRRLRVVWLHRLRLIMA